MQLNLSVNDQLLASVPVDPKRRKDSQYIQAMCRLLAHRNRMAISALRQEPMYYLEISSRMRRSRQQRA